MRKVGKKDSGVHCLRPTGARSSTVLPRLLLVWRQRAAQQIDSELHGARRHTSASSQCLEPGAISRYQITKV